MYQPLETDVSGRNYQDEMQLMLTTMIPAYEVAYIDKYGDPDDPEEGLPGIGTVLIKEFNDMLEFAGATVTGVEDRALAVLDYLNCHYAGAEKPEWYANLTGGQK